MELTFFLVWCTLGIYFLDQFMYLVGVKLFCFTFINPLGQRSSAFTVI